MLLAFSGLRIEHFGLEWKISAATIHSLRRTLPRSPRLAACRCFDCISCIPAGVQSPGLTLASGGGVSSGFERLPSCNEFASAPMVLLIPANGQGRQLAKTGRKEMPSSARRQDAHG